MNIRTTPRLIVALAAGSIVAVACGSGGGSASDATGETGGAANASPAAAPDGRTELRLWTHNAGNPAEMENVLRWIEEYNESQDEYFVVNEAFPQGDYNETVVAAALSESMPCILDVDAPLVPNWAWAGYLAPLDLPSELTDAFLDSTKGFWDGQQYAQGQYDAAVALMGRRSDFEDLDLRIPTLEDPWTAAEFQEALDGLKGEYEYAFDPGMAWTGEWYPYAFSPFLQSFGGDLLDRDSLLSAEGVLNGPEAVAWGEWWQRLFADGYAPGTSQDTADRDTGFVDGKYGLSWNGIWASNTALEELGTDEVLFLPAPDFGHGSVIGAGSWQWAVSAACEHPEAAQAWIESTLTAENVAAIADAQNVIPGRGDARELTEKFAEGAPLSAFYELSAAQALIRPPTPAYPQVAGSFEKAAADIADGADVQNALDTAVDGIDREVEDNNAYGQG